jgi:hypothetical protein
MSNRCAQPILLCPPFALKQELDGMGMLTHCPSPFPLGFGLGPTNPTRIDLS